ncbi:MAG: hypothetical protein RLZZ127_1516 [Planctomycetota bacterium]|jgi:hypothetical protein
MSRSDMSPTEWLAHLEAQGHVLRRNQFGKIDEFVLNTDYHNGPGCVVCDDSWCSLCREPVEPCKTWLGWSAHMADRGKRIMARPPRRPSPAARASAARLAARWNSRPINRHITRNAVAGAQP